MLWKRRRNFRRLWLCSFCIVFLLVLPIGLYFRFRPVLTDFSESQALWVITKVANDAVEQTLLECADLCDTIVAVTYTDEERVSSVVPDTKSVNLVRTAVTQSAMKAMEREQSLIVTIPLGTLLGTEWLSGWGPLVSFPISCTATVLSDVSSSVESVAINQSIYTLNIELDVRLLIVSPGGRSSVATKVAYPMAETVLLGEVPDNLTEVYGDDQTLLGQIFDYGTVE